jgi:serine protease Do
MDNKDEEFDFIKEKIKDKPINKKKVAMKVGGVVILAIVFGIVSCCAFYIAQPWAKKKFAKVELQDPVKFPDETNLDSEANEETQETETPVVVRETVDLEIEDFKKLYGKLYDVAMESRKALVFINTVTNDTDILFEKEYEKQGNIVGLIVYDDSQFIYILAEQRGINDTDSITVTFFDDTQAEAARQSSDSSTGLAVIKVPIAQMEEDTHNKINVGIVNTPSSCKFGEPVIAVGNPSGRNSFVQYGCITSKSSTFVPVETSSDEKATTYDINYPLIHTDMAGNGYGSGIIINLDGSIAGFITQKFGEASSSYLTAFEIKSIKTLIENLCNKSNIPYMGIKGMDVPEALTASDGIPKGIFIERVASDSPAAVAGLMGSDVITSINGVEMNTTEDFKKIIEEASPEQSLEIIVQRKSAEEYVEMAPFTVKLGVL